eukprot:TRINITY_DN10357_c0_g1_i4.p1 TRINITY_DN10357_c0_g1~~TRINITY_DN10357_c0_g1_i4.p1  ORF type:complete len:145 (+),score=16.72 TRINITY_DN10357_c0_g1_i4:127-561(+)
MADVKSAREPVNLVHQEAIHAETVKKETRNQRMFTEYTVNPHRKAALLAGKPNVASTGTTTTPSKAMLSTIKQGTRVPKAKYSFPQTTSQEYGWDIESDDLKPDSELLHRPRGTTEITRFMASYWKQKEQEKLGGSQGNQQQKS